MIERLLAAGELQRVTPARNSAEALLRMARSHLSSASAVRDSDPEGAYAALYDGARKACASLLEVQGLRATSRGGHIAIRDAVLAQFAELTGGAALRTLDRLRRRRNDIEYPQGESGIDADEIDEALARAHEIVAYAEQIVEHLPVF
ncbi:MAG: hypothetical protein WDA27_01110 [Actinomycetota bacterium]